MCSTAVTLTRVALFFGVLAIGAASAGGLDAGAALEEAVAHAASSGADGVGVCFPDGAIVERSEWDGAVLHIDLTVPADAKWELSPLEVEELSASVGRRFMDDPGFGGVVVRVRIGEDGVYGTLERFVAPAVSGVMGEAEFEPDAGLVTRTTEAPSIHPDEVQPRSGLGGAVTQGARQPVGSLSGVTFFVNAGHGWTAGTSAWELQRAGDLWDMNEDYGNIDQINYVAHYAFNAGATVVPFRPIGWQPIEIVLDNDDTGVTFSGSWANGSATKYYENGVTSSGVLYRAIAASTTETATARYTPSITETGFYPVYCFTIASSNRTRQTYRISHSGGISEVVVDHRLVGNGWVWLGEYHFESGGTNYVEISNQSPDTGYVIADAIRWGSGMGDLSRPGPNSVSGYPRDAECARYWAHSELGENAVGFTASAIWDSSTTDKNDNVRTAAHWAKEMNQTAYNNDRWRRVFLEFHTNAFDGARRGCKGLITDLGATTNQAQFATIMADEIDADMLVLDADFEHTWNDQASSTYTGSYGAICTGANGNEFDATIMELAFHDNEQDAQLLRDSRVRAALAKSSVQGVIRFLNSLSGSTVPLAFPPETPGNVRAIDAGDGDVALSWAAPPSGSAYGDPATGYVIYQSSNGYGFGNPVTVGNVLTTTLSGLPVGETRYYRIAATNAGGESMSSDVLAVRRESAGAGEALIVSGFDRLRRAQNVAQEFTFPPAYVGDSPERVVWRWSNTFDYAVQFAEALGAIGIGFSSCSNEAIGDGDVDPADFPAVMWISGEESTQDETFDADEQAAIESYLDGGGNLFVSGPEIGWDLDAQGSTADRSFYNNYLKADYVRDDANTYDVSATAGSIFDGVAAFSFDDGSLFYDSQFPDGLNTSGGSTAALSYVGGNGGTAATVFDGAFKTVTFGFPFETITTAAAREDVMLRVARFFFPGVVCVSSSDCDDGVYCNGAETCVDHTCGAGTAIDCDDGVACTDDSCNEAGDTCDNVTNDANCDNGLFCDGDETCDAVQDCVSGVDPCSGLQCDEVSDQCITEPTVVYAWNMDTDPGWTTAGLWAWGSPTGGGGDHGGPDPTGGYTGSNVYGYNLSGDYQNGLAQTHLTTTAIDCGGLTDVSLKYRRWLGVEQPSYDHAYLRVSNNGSTWTTLWENVAEVSDGAWVSREFDISSVADGQSTVYLRWTMGTTDGSWQYCGWNIDDVEIWGLVSDPECDENSDCDDGLFCTGVEVCSGGFCVEGSDPCPGQGCDEAGDQCVGREVIYEWTMDSDPGWTEQGLWNWGQPSGGGGQYGNADPTSGYTGVGVYGYNLSGDYENSLSERHLTTSAIDCTGLTGVTLEFQRWLGVEQPQYDHAYVRVSNNGSSWSTVWQNTLEVADGAWSLQEFDISAVADGEPTVYVRWTMGTTDGSWQYCGWNIDDVRIRAFD